MRNISNETFTLEATARDSSWLQLIDHTDPCVHCSSVKSKGPPPPSAIPEYNPLLDKNLRSYFSSEQVQRQLYDVGLVSWPRELDASNIDRHTPAATN